MKKVIFASFSVFMLLAVSACVIYVPRTERKPGRWQEPYESREEYRDFSRRMDISYFYDYLSPYGMWIQHSPYGYVWVPDVPYYGWRPYSYGRWVWTDFGWTWVSHFKWGWAPFHYGRWDWDAQWGWFWVPDVVWGPAWVTWRTSHLYIGWAPLPPGVRFVSGVGIRSVSFPLDDRFWIFVEGPYFLDGALYRYVLPRERNRTLIRSTVYKTQIVVRDRRVINEGLDLDEAQRITKQRISKFQLKDASGPVQSKVRMGDVEVFRPTVLRSGEEAPKKVWSGDEAAERISRTGLVDPGKRIPVFEGETPLEDLHSREVRVLERTQKRELEEAEGQFEEKKKAAKTSEEKQKIEQAYREKLKKLKQSHEEEKTEIQKRHENEEGKVKKRKIKE